MNNEPIATYRLQIKGVLNNQKFLTDFEKFLSELIYSRRINGLSQTLIKLTASGIPDIYQGNEIWNSTLVDPDNRRPVDFNHYKKLLHFRKKHSVLFSSQAKYIPIEAQGRKFECLVSFMRGDDLLITVLRFLFQLKENWDNTSLELPKGLWLNLFTKEKIEGRKVFAKEIFKNFPVAIFHKQTKEFKS